MKTNKEVVQAFFDGEYAQNGSMTSYSDGSLYSYDTKIAEFFDNETIIVNCRRYSNTTSKHQSIVKRDMSEDYEMVCITSGLVPWGYQGKLSKFV